VDLDLEWERADHGWVLRRETAVVRLHGRELRLERSAATSALAAAPGPLALTLARSLGRVLAPEPLHAAEACWSQYLDYVAKTAVLALATELVIASPDKVSAGLVWLAAWEEWRQALDRYTACELGLSELP